MIAAWWTILAYAAPTDVALVSAYESIRVPLAHDDLAGARAAASALQHTDSVPAEIGTAAEGVADASAADAVRLAFGELSRQFMLRLAADGPPDGLRVYRCPMTAAYPYWLQTTSGLANPYMGTAMPTCGEGTSFKAALRAAEGR